jgi:hypothetical protein
MQPAIKRNQRWLPALVVMVLIFWFSSLPGEQVGQTARPALDHAPKIVTLEPLGKPVRIQWLKVGHGVGYALLGLAYLYALRPVNRRAAALAVLLALGLCHPRRDPPGVRAGQERLANGCGAGRSGSRDSGWGVAYCAAAAIQRRRGRAKPALSQAWVRQVC